MGRTGGVQRLANARCSQLPVASRAAGCSPVAGKGLDACWPDADGRRGYPDCHVECLLAGLSRKLRICARELSQDVADVPCGYPVPGRHDARAAVIGQDDVPALVTGGLPSSQDYELGFAAMTLALGLSQGLELLGHVLDGDEVLLANRCFPQGSFTDQQRPVGCPEMPRSSRQTSLVSRILPR